MSVSVCQCVCVCVCVCIRTENVDRLSVRSGHPMFCSVQTLGSHACVVWIESYTHLHQVMCPFVIFFTTDWIVKCVKSHSCMI